MIGLPDFSQEQWSLGSREKMAVQEEEEKPPSPVQFQAIHDEPTMELDVSSSTMCENTIDSNQSMELAQPPRSAAPPSMGKQPKVVLH